MALLVMRYIQTRPAYTDFNVFSNTNTLVIPEQLLTSRVYLTRKALFDRHTKVYQTSHGV